MNCPTPAGRKILGSHFFKHGRRTRIKFARFDPQLLVMWIDCRNFLLISASLIKKSSAIYLIFHCFSYVWSWVNSGLWKLPVEIYRVVSFFRTPPQKYDASVCYRLPLKNEIRRVDCVTRIVATLFETLLNACEVWPAGVYQNYFNSDFYTGWRGANKIMLLCPMLTKRISSQVVMIV